MNYGPELDAIGFGFERARMLGLTKRNMTTDAMLHGFGCKGHILVVRRRKWRKPLWDVLPPDFSASKVLASFLP